MRSVKRLESKIIAVVGRMKTKMVQQDNQSWLLLHMADNEGHEPITLLRICKFQQ